MHLKDAAVDVAAWQAGLAGRGDGAGMERMKRHALALCACVGRLHSDASSGDEARVAWEHVVGAANLLGMDLASAVADVQDGRDPLSMLADGTGALADAAEKLDHLEDGAGLARRGVAMAAAAVLAMARSGWADLGPPPVPAEEFVRRVLGTFGQEADEALVRRVAAEVRRTVPPFR